MLGIQWLCSHKAKNLVVYKDATEQEVDEIFTRVTYHLMCQSCGKRIDIKYAKVNPDDPYIGDCLK
jgi:Fe2+ or Zn2+ uptake regulation protein